MIIWKYIILMLIGVIAINQIMNPTYERVVYGKSMEPLLHNGDNIVLEEVSSLKDINLGDIVVYETEDKHTEVIHRVVYIGEDTNGKYILVEGDGNSMPDGEFGWVDEIDKNVVFLLYKIRLNQIIGKVT